MRTLLLLLCAAAVIFAQEAASLIKQGDFKYENQPIAIVPFSCKDAILCDIIIDEFGDLLFEYFGANFIDSHKVKKAIRKAGLKILDEENRAAIANHLKVNYLLYFNLDIVPSQSMDISNLQSAEIILIEPNSGKEVLKIQSISERGMYFSEENIGSKETVIQKRLQDMFHLAFD